MSKKFFVLPLLMGALFVAATTKNAHADSGTGTDAATTELQIDPIAEVTVTNNLTAFTPIRSDYVAGHMEQQNGISLNVFANKAYTVTVDGQTAGATLSSDDLFVKAHPTAVYPGAISSQRILASSANASAVSGDIISLDVKVGLTSAGAYAPSATAYSNTMVFTVTAAS